MKDALKLLVVIILGVAVCIGANRLAKRFKQTNVQASLDKPTE